jgi:hypothetical protein
LVFGSTLSDTLSLTYDQEYSFLVQADAEAFVVSVPETGPGLPAGLLCASMLAWQAVRRRAESELQRTSNRS